VTHGQIYLRFLQSLWVDACLESLRGSESGVERTSLGTLQLFTGAYGRRK